MNSISARDSLPGRCQVCSDGMSRCASQSANTLQKSSRQQYSAVISIAIEGQGCSMLWDDEKSEQIIDASEGGAVAVLAERAGAVGLENVEGETAQAGEHAGIGADARAVFAQGDVAAVVGGGLDPPMRAHRLGRAGS